MCLVKSTESSNPNASGPIVDGRLAADVYLRWLPPREAIKVLKPLLNDYEAKRELYRRLCGGEVLSVARSSIWYKQSGLDNKDYSVIGAFLWSFNRAPEDHDLLWKTGTYVMSRITSPHSSTKYDVECFGLRFDPAGIFAILTDVGMHAVIPEIGNHGAQPIDEVAHSRAPAFKHGPAPSDSEIISKADEMQARGMRGRDIAKSMRLEGGFENVSTVHVRELILGRYPRTGRRGSQRR